jgi:ferredoxin
MFNEPPGRGKSFPVPNSNSPGCSIILQISSRHCYGSLPAMRIAALRPELSYRRGSHRHRARQCPCDRSDQMYWLQRPHRTVWNPYKNKSSKCDLCVDAPFWSKKGGPDGEPACVTSCPAKALKIVHEAPPQEDVAGYDVNLAPPMPKMPFRKPGTPIAKEPAPKS